MLEKKLPVEMSVLSAFCSLLVIATLTPSISSQCYITATDCNTVNNVCGQIPGTLTCEVFQNLCAIQLSNCFKGTTYKNVATTFCGTNAVGTQAPCIGMTAANNPNPPVAPVQPCTATANDCFTNNVVCGYLLGTNLCQRFKNLCDLQNKSCALSKTFAAVSGSYCNNSPFGARVLCNGNPANSGSFSSSSNGVSVSNTNTNTLVNNNNG